MKAQNFKKIQKCPQVFLPSKAWCIELFALGEEPTLLRPPITGGPLHQASSYT